MKTKKIKEFYIQNVEELIYRYEKYVLLLDEDDIFGQRDAFSTLYKLAEKDDLDMLGFSSMFTESSYSLGTYIHSLLWRTYYFPTKYF